MKHTTLALTILIGIPSIAVTNYSPSGCVEARFSTNQNGKAEDIFFSKHHPKDLFLEEAYNNVKGGTFTPNQKEIVTLYQFQNDNSWPLPFECLDEKNKEKYSSNFELNELQGSEFKDTKNAIDTMFFQSMYDTFDITNISTSQEENIDGTVNLSVSLTYNFDAKLANKLSSHYFKTRYSTSESGSTKYIEILREKSNHQLPDQDANDILDYIGQRIPVITIDIGEHRKSILVGAPLNSDYHCGGNVAKREGFKKYCLTHENNDGSTVTFKNLNVNEVENFTINPVFRITNSYLLALPK
tara:strand:- start:50620 stop:51516 length:897 start_codon:yes stop_codon:yes gene_type:complete